ncbi:uncharacterized protein [Elaeis guineensis]|uniref:Uncharacterized protein LOC105032371 n=1 Tax=Elaeis guineensis var. tenera TaxID=51953 RepID=A0A6I9Q992_ELAGV|nr:uncharacterized protein LOC105032371 [Elaeis guineensis]
MATMGHRSWSSSAWVLSLRTVVVSAGVLSTALMLRLSGPSIIKFLASEFPRMYVSLLSWLTPPYLYFVINGIIISIAASSRFQKPAPEGLDPSGSVPSVANSTVIQPPLYVPPTEEYVAKVAEGVRPEFVEPAVYGGAEVEGSGVEMAAAAAAAEEVEGEEDFVISRSSWSPKRRESRETATEYSAVTEKPLVSVRFGHRKNVKPSPEGNALRVARPKRNETLESTWRTITEGRPVPLARHLKKSDTWETHGRASRDEQSPAPLMRKAETFNDRAGRSPVASSSPSPLSSGGRLRRDPSLGQDDLNRRVEAFIKKFNEEMRLQRQESYQHYMEMINRGSH